MPNLIKLKLVKWGKIEVCLGFFTLFKLLFQKI